MKRALLSFIGLAVAGMSFAQVQEDKCGTYDAYEDFRVQYPELSQDAVPIDDLFSGMKIFNTQGSLEAKAAPYRIPVVVHVLHMYGNENVNDSYVYGLIDQLNLDYSATNPDISEVHPNFTAVIGDAQVEFVLAAIDPVGNCTNGIEHIWTHETNSGERQIHKVGQWDRSHYFNIWIMDNLETSGLLGYATFPTMVDGSFFWQDGVAVRSDNTALDRTLTHEVGHWLGLCHTFGCTGTAGDDICEDDNAMDTPPTDGSWDCPLNEDECDPGVTIENVQNYMDYRSCLRNFTQDQVAIMHNALEGITGQRNKLWEDTTLMETGVMNLQLPQVPTNDVNNLTVPLCAPVADFHCPDKTVCVGSFASFSDESWNAVIADRTWTFEGGTPATSTSSNVNVSWDTPGWKKVTLMVSNDAGSDTKEESHYIYVAPDWPDYVGPTSLNMESNTHLFIVDNPENNHGTFSVVNTATQGKAWKLQTYKDISQADLYTDDWFYNMRLGGSVDHLISPAFDLRNTTGITVTFKFAYATNATDDADITEQLRVYSSRDCGNTWTARKTISGTNLITAGYAGNSDFAPTNAGQWVESSFTYTPTASDNKTRFRFEFTASDLSSNLFIDDINVTGVLGINDDVIGNMNLEVYPNPTSGQPINVTYMAQNEPTEFILRDVQGKIIAQQVIDVTNAQVTQTLNGTENLASSYYFLEVKTGESSITKKVVVL
jgi:PKD repeat protein